MSKQDRNIWIASLAKELSRQYKQEGFDMKPGVFFRMAREMVEEMDEDFE